jgi:hypothetical protein
MQMQESESIELCINDDAAAADANAMESSVSTYDSMMQTLNEELNNDNGPSPNPDVFEDPDFEDIDFFKMDCATAMSFDYDMNYTMKQLKHIAGYYGLKPKPRKADVIQDIVVYETNPANCDAMARRKRLFHYMDTLKNDEYFKSYIMI